MDRVENAHYLRYWDLDEDAETGGDVTSAARVATKADAVAASYRRAGFDSYPGLTLQRGVDVPQDSLGICVAPFGWAIIHTNDEYFQTITHSDRKLDGVEHRVWFGDILEIGTVCFIDRDLAIEVIGTWMSGGGLLEAAGFTDDLFAA
jgi:hypothetical protein